MNEDVVGLIPAAIVGFFTLAAVYMQNRHHASETARRLEHERSMAAEAFHRERTAAENERLASRIAEQLAWGDRLGVAVGRAKYLYSKASSQEERWEMLRGVLEAAGYGPGDNFFSPLVGLLEPELLEDDELRKLVLEHQATLHQTDFDLAVWSDHKPEVLPQSPFDLIDGLRDLKKRIELRVRELKRQGRPL